MGCIPVGMEQFPASNMSQMEYIKMMLEDCDYYILILAGKYGYIDSDGVGFTEKEYDYAIKKRIPVMSFIIEDIGTLPLSLVRTLPRQPREQSQAHPADRADLPRSLQAGSKGKSGAAPLFPLLLCDKNGKISQ